MERPSLIRLLEELLGQPLSREGRVRAARHVLRCRTCRRHLAEYRRIREALASAAAPKPYDSQ